MTLLYSLLALIHASCPFLDKFKISMSDATLYAASISLEIWDSFGSSESFVLAKHMAISINFL